MSIVSGSLQAMATMEAASTQAQAARDASQVQLQMYQQAREDMAPWRDAGSWAVNNLQRIIAAGPGGRLAPMKTGGVNALVSPGPASPAGSQPPPAGGGTQLPANAVVGPGQYGQTFVPAGYWGMPIEMGEGTLGVGEIQPIPSGSVTAQGSPVGMQPGQGQGTGQPQNALVQTGGPELSEDWGSDWTSRYQESPYYNFLVGEGTKALERGAAAKGKQFSGAQGKALQTFGQNMALTDYDNWLKNWYQSLTPWQSLAGLGQTSGAQTGSAALQTGQGVAQNILAGGNAAAAGQMGMGNIGARTSSNLIQNALNYYYKDQGGGYGTRANDNPYSSGYNWAGAYGATGEGAGGMSAYDWAAMMGY